MGLIVNFVLLLQEPHPWRKPPGWLLLAVPLGLALGIWVAKLSTGGDLQIVAGGVAVAGAGLLLFAKVRLPNKAYLLVATGGLSAFLQATTSLSGPPLVILLTAQERSKHELRVTLFSTFLILGVAALCGYAVAGVFPPTKHPIPFINDRAIFIVDKNGKIAWSKIYELREQPDNGEILAELKKLS